MKKKLTISLGADSNDEIVSKVNNFLISKNYKVNLYGELNNDDYSWVEISKKIALDVQNKRANLGIIFCYTGTGVTIVANRFKGIRATLCNNEEIAICAKKWNDSNILTMGLISVDRKRIENIIMSWINTEVDKEELGNIKGIDDLK
ncbi:RpiB/LacA/LacB family sugar-phosphate isomerase [bacterium]|nr:RpiB/LacA/LacB family sugar-phosphate isomerase [bacterium]|tara:strand:- start:414 stop:854 length:441 start_codon:yes stop_codon:yes gene_type:complete